MSEELDNIAANLKQPSAWIRIFFMLAFTVVLYIIIAPVILVLMLAQALFSVVSGRSNANLNYLGAAIAKYVSQILEFITYNSEEKPFPFSDFPDIDVDATAGQEPKPKPKPKQKREPNQAHKPAQEPAADTGSNDTSGTKTVRKKSTTGKSAPKRSNRNKDTAETPESSAADE